MVISITPGVIGVNFGGVTIPVVVATPVRALLCGTMLTALLTTSLSPHPGDLSG